MGWLAGPFAIDRVSVRAFLVWDRYVPKSKFRLNGGILADQFTLHA